ncbi:hypothetical protein IJ118_01305 [Candidatus Saccharibacteria bacterium]|nr:hypothetical protein [Candidatus Saccharibacteria bacterium]
MIIKSDKIVSTDNFKNEKELQRFFERNLKIILGIDFVETEFVVGDFRVDTFAYDSEANAFKIIEYKNSKNYSLVDQGYTYLKMLSQHKADFVLRYNRNCGKNIDISDIDWSQSRVVFVSPSYTSYQMNAADFYDAPYDLIKVTKYDDGIVDIDFIKHTSNVSIKEVSANSDDKADVDKEIKVYTEKDHLRDIPDSIIDLYTELKERILDLGDIDIDPKKYYIAFKGASNICDIEVQHKQLKITANLKYRELGDIVSPKVRDISRVGHWGNGECEISVKNQNDIDSAMPIIRKSFQKNQK